MNIGENIQKLRKRSNMTQQDLADSLGISRSAISRIESKSSLDTDLLLRVSKAFNIPLIALLYDETNEPYEYIAAEVLAFPKSIRDLHSNNIELYRKLPDKTRNFIRAIGIEIYNEILNSESKAVENFSKGLQGNIAALFDDANSSLKKACIKFIDDYTNYWVNEILKERSY
ncbi:helix-turn-helix domain-containing protein [Clostridium bovifaecis]|uniref:Helix-turn-helix domain-containing protein n=1 Tax=Clostridium bovifaecis TaxID=2184719 RepID=A0A6I6F3S9_9CLOT|nr:helix-turn-helix domain-containing protein [Clostridium bovifaecis]